MAWPCSVHNARSLRSYGDAKLYFSNTKLPRSKYWTSEWERPLYNTAAPHMKVVKLDNGYSYGLQLYRTVMVKYDRPDPDDGSYVVHLAHYDSNAAYEFLWRMGWYAGREFYATCGRTVTLPTTKATTLVFTKEGKLLLEESVHAPVYSPRVSAARSAERSAFKRALQPFLDMVPFKMEEMQKDLGIVAGWRRSTTGHGSFASARVGWDTERALVRVRVHASTTALTQEEIEKIIELLQSCYEACTERNDTRSDAANPPVTAEQVQSMFIAAALRAVGLNTPDASKELPQFAESYPKNITL